jgi:ribosome-binding protein aMBF1 (putative translation factor)
MTLQIIKSTDGKNEYVLLPFSIYRKLHDEIEATLKKSSHEESYVPFDPADYVDNPIALARIKRGITQKELAAHMKVTQAYISKIERQENVTAKLLNKVNAVLLKHHKN